LNKLHGNILYEKNSHEKLRPASVTKIMTILLIMEALNNGQITYDTQISCSENAASMGGSQIWLEVRRNFNSRRNVKSNLRCFC
jgi:D-alanyl-D-alanine carboxypeptidase (penicillin-binding protein 5/6)